MTNKELIHFLERYPDNARILIMDAGVSQELDKSEIILDPDGYDLYTEEDTFNTEDIKAIIFDPGNYLG